MSGDHITDTAFALECVLGAVPDGIVLLDGLGRITRANRAACELLGIDEQAETPAWAESLFADPAQFRGVFEFVLSRPGANEEACRFHAVMRHRQGTTFRASLSLQATASSRDGDLLCVLHLRDVELESRADDTLLEVTERLKKLVANAPLAIMLFDSDGIVHMWNPAAERTFGYRAEDVVGRYLPVVPEDRHDDFLVDLSESSRGERPDGFETVWRCKDGTLLTVARWTTAIRGFDGELHWLGIVADVSQRKKLERELAEHAEALAREARLKNDFLAMLSHELRNPLFPLVSAAGVLRRHTDGTSESRRTLDLVDRQLRKLKRLVDDLLDASRIHGGKLDLRRERVAVRDAIEAGVESVRTLAESKEQVLSLDIAEGLFVEGDPVRLEQVFGNLVHNAVKYTDRRGQVAVEARRMGEAVVIRIQDTGVGMVPDTLETLFQPFAQAERSRHLAEGGLGLGLALVRALVVLPGGRVSAHSDGAGTGSTFEVRLPAAEASEQRGETTGSGAHPANGHRCRVLLVDDDEDATSMVAELMGYYGHEAVALADGAAALRVVEQQAFDVALLDLELRGISGYDLATKLRQLPNGRNMRLVAISGHGGDAARERSAGAGFSQYLVKPVDSTVLLSVLTTDPAKSEAPPG